MDCVDVEIRVVMRRPAGHTVRFSCRAPGFDAVVETPEQPILLDLEKLLQLKLDPQAYGKELGDALFAPGEIRGAFTAASTLASSRALLLRLRLKIDASSGPLHILYWETLLNPLSNRAFATDENVLLSRFISSTLRPPPGPLDKGGLKALVAIANPSNLSEYDLVTVDVERTETRSARASLSGVAVTALASGGQANLDNIFSHLRDGYDIFYLVGHGAMVRNEPFVYLEDAAGKVARIAGEELVARCADLRRLPRLIVLASCQSGGDAGRAMLAALGPRLASIGIPAVVAMHGDISVDTADAFAHKFFEELDRDGVIDRSVAVARGTVRTRHDWWKIMLFMSLDSGRLWAEAPEETASARVPHVLPPPVADFVGRDADVEELVAHLSGDSASAAITGLRGMGGIGKTQLALRRRTATQRHLP